MKIFTVLAVFTFITCNFVLANAQISVVKKDPKTSE